MCGVVGCKSEGASQPPVSDVAPGAGPVCVAPSQPSTSWAGDEAWPTPMCRERASTVLATLSLEEKVAQMLQVDCKQLSSPAELTAGAYGSVLCGGDSAPPVPSGEAWAEFVDAFHRAAGQTRHSIPLLFGIDAVHGHNAVQDAVLYPHNIGLGATRDPALLERIGRVTAEDVRATGINWVFAPVLAAAQDERWGRTYESFSEDPVLAAELGAALIRGLQGERLGQSPTSVLATAKHFLADGHTARGIDQGDAKLDAAYVREHLLPAYRLAVETGVGSVMASYSSIEGTKMHCAGPLVTDALKRELGFNGLVVSDWEAIEKIPGDYADRLADSINAGLDMIMHPADHTTFVSTVTAMVPERIPEARIDDAVARILGVKCEMGLLGGAGESHTPTLAQRDKLALLRARQRTELAREAVRKSVVVLSNEGVLPLARGGRIHVAGRNADDLGNQCGGWSITWQGSSGPITAGTTILAGIRAVAGKDVQVTYALDGSGAQGASVGVVVVGETPYAETQGDARDLRLSADDVAAVQTLKAARIPVVVVVVSGRPLVLDEILDHADAIVAAWLPGTEGAGVADVLFGDVAPTGKLPLTWPRQMDQIPIAETGPGRALFPRGHGLTYAP